MRIVVAKPDPGTVGEFERVLQRIVARLRARGHDVRVATVRTDLPVEAVLDRAVSRDLERAAPELLAHLAQLGAFRRLDLRSADVVVSTQPPSQAIQHPRHLALFYHHNRQFYDLTNLLVTSGHVTDPGLHLELATVVREADRPGMAGVSQYLVPSGAVAERLRRFNGIEHVLPFHAGPAIRVDHDGTDPPPRHHVLCVSPHEFPKRTELFVQAGHLMSELPVVCAGNGTRLEFVRRIDENLDLTATVDPTAPLWSRRPTADLPVSGRGGKGRVRFVTDASPAELSWWYRAARCVVAPALDEDYGWTAVQAMAFGVPLVVCSDGGSLAELVHATGAGLVVAPTAEDIAENVRRIVYDPQLAGTLGDAGLAAARERFTWPRAFDQFETALARVAAT